MRKSVNSWTGDVLLSLTRALYVGHVFDTNVHAHHAIQISIALDTPLGLREAEDRPWQSYQAAIVASNRAHQLDGRGGRHVLLYLEPESIDGRRISRTLAAAGIERLPASVLGNVRNVVERAERVGPDIARAREMFADVFRSLDLAPVTRSPLDDRIGGAVRELRANPNRYGSIPRLAACAGLSASRFRHLFTAEMGVSCRQYLLWVRLYNAVRELASGATLTEAAHKVGFSDAAYLTRTFRRMFGIAPSAISRSVHLVADPDPQ